MNTNFRKTGLRACAFGLLVLLCCGVAQAGGRKTPRVKSDRTVDVPRTEDDQDDSELTATDTTSSRLKTATVVEADAAALGGIDPTTVPIVDEDLKFAVMSTPAQLGAGDAHAVATGRGVVVAVLDGGFSLEHPDIAGNLGLGYDAIDGDYDPHDPGNGIDDDGDGIVDAGGGHGTFVAGMVLLAAPDATIVPIRIRDDEGWGTNAQTLRGLQFARSIGADVINLSITNADWGKKGIVDLISEIIEAGVPVIVSAGNNSFSILEKEMALSELTLAVGAVDQADVLAPFSNYAWFAPMIYAPGVDLWGPIGTPTPDTRGFWSGTSFAAGIVSGAAALLLEVRPDCPPLDVYAHLRHSVDPAYNAWGWPLSSGRINLLKVVTP